MFFLINIPYVTMAFHSSFPSKKQEKPFYKVNHAIEWALFIFFSMLLELKCKEKHVRFFSSTIFCHFLWVNVCVFVIVWLLFILCRRFWWIVENKCFTFIILALSTWIMLLLYVFVNDAITNGYQQKNRMFACLQRFPFRFNGK